MIISNSFSRILYVFFLYQSLHRTPTVPSSNSMVSSVTSNDLTLAMNLNNIKTEKSSYDNLTHSIPQFFDQISHSPILDDGYDNISIATNSPSNSSGISMVLLQHALIRLSFQNNSSKPNVHKVFISNFHLPFK